ncbi:MAG TPA: hypothetical protein VGI75_03715, partial [Pirellulales bacterium]
QTEGELRGRASRMEPIADLTTLRTVLDSLRGKGLITYLTPAGRGQILTHSLYEPEELERLKAKIGAAGAGENFEPAPAAPRAQAAPSSVAAPATMSSASASLSAVSEKIGDEMRSLRSEMAELRREFEALTETVRKQENEIADLRTSLGG